MFTYSADNGGNKASPSPQQAQPVVSQTAQQLTQASAGTNTTATVTAGARYRFTATATGGFLFGLATVATGSEANVRWVCTLGDSIEIQIPAGYTTLHYTTLVNSGIGYLVRITQ